MIKAAWKTLRFILLHPLGRRRPAAAVGRYLGWQIQQRFRARPAVMRFVNQTRLLIPPHAHGLTGYLYVGLPDFEESAFLLHLLRPGDRFADVGANAGAWTVLAAGGLRARVDSFEPIPESRRLLEANVALNGLSESVQVHPTGVGSAPGTLHFTTGEHTANRVISAEEAAKVDSLCLPIETLDAACESDCPTAMKIDVEGWELEVIRGAARLLANPILLAVVIETFRHANLEDPQLQEMEGILAEAGFAPSAYDPIARRLKPLGDVPSSSSDNTIYARSAPELAARLASAPAFTIFGQRY